MYECIGRDVRPRGLAPILAGIQSWYALFSLDKQHSCTVLNV